MWGTQILLTIVAGKEMVVEFHILELSPAPLRGRGSTCTLIWASERLINILDMKNRNPNLRLKRAREACFLTQQQLAEKIGAAPRSISRYERGERLPDLFIQKRLCEVLGKTPEELGFSIESFEGSIEQYTRRTLHEQEQPYPPIWNVPPRIPFFIGRSDTLQTLYDALIAGKTATLTQAVSGLGGIGKTQTAIEYAYRCRDEYQAVLWVQADTRDNLISGFLEVARLLGLSVTKQKEPERVVDAVKEWMKTHPLWLLVLDNVEDLKIIQEIIAAAKRGHIIVTTRSQTMGGSLINIELADMTPEEGALLLLRRSQRIAPDAILENASEEDREIAKHLSQMMDGLPLALDLAAAYIQETGHSLSSYLRLYQEQRAKLLNWHSAASSPYPRSVAATLSLSLSKIETNSPVAADLLRLCAFLHPDAIPEEIVIAGSAVLGPLLQKVTSTAELDEVIAELRKYSLVRRLDNQMLSIHRLVQAVFLDRMDQDTQREWAERTVRAVHKALQAADSTALHRDERYIPQAQTCAMLIEQWAFSFREAASLLLLAGHILRERARYTLAEVFSQQALAVSERIEVPEDTALVVNCILNLAFVYQFQGEFARAEPLFQRALAIGEQRYGPEHPLVADSLNNLAYFYASQNHYSLAEQLYQRALTIYEQKLGPEDPALAPVLDNLTALYLEQGRNALAEQCSRRASEIREGALGQSHPRRINDLIYAAIFDTQQGNYARAESRFQLALAAYKRTVGLEHPTVALLLTYLADVYTYQNKYADAEETSQQALSIRKKLFGLQHPDVARSLMQLARLSQHRKDYIHAESLYHQALTILKQAYGLENIEVAQTFAELAVVSHNQAKYSLAKSYFEQALTSVEGTVEPEYGILGYILVQYASLLRKMRRWDELEQVLERLRVIQPGWREGMVWIQRMKESEQGKP